MKTQARIISVKGGYAIKLSQGERTIVLELDSGIVIDQKHAASLSKSLLADISAWLKNPIQIEG